MTSLVRVAAVGAKTLIAALLVTALTLLVAPRILGWQLQLVLSGSMAPAFDTGAVIAIRPVPASSINVGDVITIRRPDGAPVTHRVLEVHGSGAAAEFVTKGDANDDIDAQSAPASAVAGEVVAYAPYLGYLAHFVRQPLGFLLLIMMAGVAFLLGETSSIVRNRTPKPAEAVTT